MVGIRPTRSRAGLLAALVAATLLLAGCTPPEPQTLTVGERDDICRTLHDPVAFTAASAVYSPVFLYRSYGPAVPGSSSSFPYPDCAYRARSEYADRLEVFYFGPEEKIVEQIVALFNENGYVQDDNLWTSFDPNGQPQATARVSQFYGPPDASDEYRVYAELINRPTVVVTITSRHDPMGR